MLLAIDVGNTHIEIGLYEGSEYLTSWRIATGGNRTEDELMGHIYQFLLLGGYSVSKIKAIAIASVVPQITQILHKLSEKYFKLDPLTVDHTIDVGLVIRYNPPSAVGADRICNAVAAFTKFGGPDIIVDFGTATTFDVVSREGEYLGGAIAPGLETTASSLHEKASKLPRISLEFPGSAIGKTTDESMQSGIMLGSIKMVDGLISLISAELKDSPMVIATGGLAKILAPKSKFIKYIEPNLVLDGLVNIFFRNRTID